MRLTAAIVKEGKFYVARCIEVEVASQGNSMEEALDNLKEALELYFEDEALELISSPIIAPLDIEVRT
ncbi:type II toxin-antitoxin system HicB family antitoxin [Ammoniphilus resinae]|uniref:RNase H-like HicB family nuclease n=1 Tax=Ammoniphilus resinae TaxID=861532 RepID=A0ABS4GXI8_9BACL|nr:type II toxin-antitoxin system HicB family antitoxin [Ammoniphilus resinae]MBP1934974.1 putative RNase H-like HicB family nuclease [Ammoniphilus resinae]